MLKTIAALFVFGKVHSLQIDPRRVQQTLALGRRSDPPAPRRRSDPDVDLTNWVDWDVCNSTVTSTLGDKDGSIRFTEVVQVGDEMIDLVITNQTEYYAKNASKNGRDECIGLINVLNEAPAVRFKFQFVETGTDTEAAPHNYLFSIYDIDRGGKAVEYTTFVDAVVAYWVSNDSTINVTGSIEGNLTASATLIGNDADNPSDPANMTDEQLSTGITVMFDSVSSFEIVFDVEVESSKGGRNIMFSGWSELAPTLAPTPSPTPAPTYDYVNWSFCDVTSMTSNLGGEGPDFTEALGLRYRNVYNGSSGAVDLLVTNTTPYTANNNSQNLYEGCLGQVNVKVQTEVTLKFQFVHADTETEVDPANYLFSLFDIDRGGKAVEQVVFVQPVETYYVDADVGFDVSGSPDSNLTFTATKKGDGADNPTDPSNLTEEQLNCSGTVLYTDVSSFLIKFAVPGSSKAGRNFIFSGWSQLVASGAV